MMKRNKLLSAPEAPDAPPRKKEGIRSWLKIQMDSEGYQPPRGGAILLQVLVGLLFFVLVVRFWYLQVHRGEEFARQAQENRLRLERIFAPRGRILDDSGKVLADNLEFKATTQFTSGQDLATAMRDASGRLMDDLSRQVVDSLLGLKWERNSENE